VSTSHLPGASTSPPPFRTEAGGVAYEETAAAFHDPRLAARLDLDPQTRAPFDSLHHAQQLAAPGGGVLRQIRPLPQRERVCHSDQALRAAHFRHQHGGVRFVVLARLDHAFRATVKTPPRRASRIRQKIGGESKRGAPRE
jgi:hypothetical protein